MSRILIVGSGIAGLMTALQAASKHEVTIVTKGALGDGSTRRAQGGIAAALTPDDSTTSHMIDTIRAGDELCAEDAVRVLCDGGPGAIDDLVSLGVDFDREGGSWSRGLEAAHSASRVLHAGGDATGAAIIAALTERVRERGIHVVESAMLVDLVVDRSVVGADLLTADGLIRQAADAVVLATGGAGHLYPHTTNPPGATGDGVAAALRAGAVVSDAEFYQFHPTTLATTGFLISEALRGAGAVLLDESGRRFMTEVDPRAELAPRSIVALALARTMARQGGRPALLDATAVPQLTRCFPTISRSVRDAGFDWTREPVPVSPAAHYWMGGIATDLDGRTTIDGLFAVGETARTGVHGANRLASNSLLEGAVFAARVAEALPGSGIRRHRSLNSPPELPVAPEFSRDELQRCAWASLGLERSERTLTAAFDEIERWERGPRGVASGRDALENRNLLLLARVIARQALARRESRGAHTRLDYPHADDAYARSASTTESDEEALAC
ncbi:L-aspartate oxidase [Paramicrobacterium sp. CJ85]|uniref:L-aspartate oxidase n=1 Tax=Paramicrobacterium sp. CJ85 TaxID=3445355 RepID=UPI003F5FE231